MTPEKRFSLISAAMNALDKKTADAIRKNPAEFCGFEKSSAPVVSAFAELLADAAAEIDKKAGRCDQAAALKNIIKSAMQDRLRGMFENGGRFCACSGFHAVRLFADVPSVPRVPDGVDVLDMERCFPEYTGQRVDLPSVAGLKKHIAGHGLTRAKMGKISPAEKKAVLYQIGPAFFNPFYLLDVMQATNFRPEDGKAVLTADARGYVTYCCPLRIETSYGDAIVLPVNPN